MNFSTEHIKDFQYNYICPKCGNDNPVFDLKSEMVKCKKCDTIFKAIGHNHIDSIIKKSNSGSYNPWSFLQLGQKFKYQKITYYIIARVDVKAKYQEYYSRNSSSGVAKYQEWFCRSIEGKELSITEDIYGYYLSRPSDHLKGSRRVKTKIEVGTAKVKYFEGESSMFSLPGTKFSYEMYRASNGKKYGFEWTQKDNKDTHYHYHQVEIEEAKLKALIAAENDISSYQDRNETYDYIKKGIISIMIILFVFLLFSMNRTGEKIYHSEVKISEIPAFGYDFKDQFINVDNNSDIYELEVGVKLHNNKSDLFSSVEILDGNKHVINLLVNDFYYYYGYEGGENWKEESQSATNYFEFEKSDNYSVRFYSEKGKNTNISKRDYMYINVYQGVVLSRYYLGMIVVLAILLYFMIEDKFKMYLKAMFMFLIFKVENLLK